jgi:hypothetical protein
VLQNYALLAAKSMLGVAEWLMTFAKSTLALAKSTLDVQKRIRFSLWDFVHWSEGLL